MMFRGCQCFLGNIGNIPETLHLNIADMRLNRGTLLRYYGINLIVVSSDCIV